MTDDISSTRVRDFLLIIGHTWICGRCREALLANPEAVLIGHKLSEGERIMTLSLKEESYRTMLELGEATGLSMDDLRTAIDHPRARLRHLGVHKRRF